MTILALLALMLVAVIAVILWRLWDYYPILLPVLTLVAVILISAVGTFLIFVGAIVAAVKVEERDERARSSSLSLGKCQQWEQEALEWEQEALEWEQDQNLWSSIRRRLDEKERGRGKWQQGEWEVQAEVQKEAMYACGYRTRSEMERMKNDPISRLPTGQACNRIVVGMSAESVQHALAQKEAMIVSGEESRSESSEWKAEDVAAAAMVLGGIFGGE